MKDNNEEQNNILYNILLLIFNGNYGVYFSVRDSL